APPPVQGRPARRRSGLLAARRRGRCRASLGAKLVASAMHRVDDAPSELAAQVVYVGVDGARRIDAVEYRIEQLTAGEDPAWGAHQHPEQRRLTLGQFDTDTADGAATYGAGHPIQAEPADAQRRAAVGSAQQCPHPGEQFWYFERFDQIVLRAGVEALDPVRDRPP